MLKICKEDNIHTYKVAHCFSASQLDLQCPLGSLVMKMHFINPLHRSTGFAQA